MGHWDEMLVKNGLLYYYGCSTVLKNVGYSFSAGQQVMHLKIDSFKQS